MITVIYRIPNGTVKSYQTASGYAIPNGSSASYYYQVKDWLGSTRITMRQNGAVENAVDYYSYGKMMPARNTFATNYEGYRYQFTGHEKDGETSYQYHGARYYDEDLARYMSVDPWADKYMGWSTYNYCMGNPVIFTDPTGKGVEYTKDEAIAMAARGKDNGYKTEVVANPDKKGDYGVNYIRTVNGKTYEGVQYEGKFNGIVKGGLKKQSMASQQEEKNQSNGFLNQVAKTIPRYSMSVSTKSVFAYERSKDIMPSGMGDKIVVTQFTETSKTLGDPNAIMQIGTRTTQNGSVSMTLKIGPIQVGGGSLLKPNSSASLDFFDYKVGAGINFFDRQFASSIGHKNNRGGTDGIRVATQVGGGTVIGGLILAGEIISGGSISPVLAPFLAP